MPAEITRYVNDQVKESSAVPSRGRGEILVGKGMKLVCSEILDRKGNSEVFVWTYDSGEHREGPDETCIFRGYLGKAVSMEIPISDDERVIVQNS